MESAHIIGDKTLEGRCCKSTAAMPCAPVLHEECMGAICSAGMAGRGVFKLGCLKPRDPEVVMHRFGDFWFLDFTLSVKSFSTFYKIYPTGG